MSILTVPLSSNHAKAHGPARTGPPLAANLTISPIDPRTVEFAR